MNYWLVQCNPNEFRCLDFLKENGNRQNWWLMYKNNGKGGEKEIQVGDIVFIWKAKGAEGKRGIYGKAKVVFVPGKDIYNNYWEPYAKDRRRKEEFRQKPSFDVQNMKLILDNPLLNSYPYIKKLEDRFYSKNYWIWRTYPLTKEEGEAIEALLDKHKGTIPSPFFQK